MYLKSIEYREFEGEPKQWRLEEFSLGDINLLVGKNSTGKSRTLNVISGLGNLVSQDVKLRYLSGDYKVTFDKNEKPITFSLKYENRKVIEEKLVIGNKVVLDRGKSGKGSIWLEKNQDYMDFQAPETVLACVNRRDEVQHPFFKDLNDWGEGQRHYRFGGSMGGEYLAPIAKEKEDAALNLKDTNLVVQIFDKGRERFPNFVEDIRHDMEMVGFDIDSIEIGVPTSLLPDKSLFMLPKGLIVKESDLPAPTEQGEVSQGMFRALSLIIQLNYSQMASIPSCILIDDIGEGLDYDRSTALIKLVIEKAKVSFVQLIMSTNDRFVMNNVPLKYWCVTQRLANTCKIHNYKNAKEKFDDFELTGLSNFDFFASEFWQNR
jgi:energy-coupling factor transporter ATP-binding protein EcfA2